MGKQTLGPITIHSQRKVYTGEGGGSFVYRTVNLSAWITFDEYALACAMGEKAFANKSKLCREVGGLVVCEVREAKP